MDGSGDHTYHYTFDFPAGFDEFYLDSYQIRANAPDTSEVDPSQFVQTGWNMAALCCGVGDVSFGSAADSGPTTSYGATLSSRYECSSCTRAWPGGTSVYSLSSTSTQFRIGWGEAGPQREGWYPWWSGTIRLR